MSKISMAVYRLTYADAAVLQYYSNRYEVDPKQVLLTALRKITAKDKSLRLDELRAVLKTVPELQQNAEYKREALEDLASFEAFRAGRVRTPSRAVDNRSRDGTTEQGRLRCSVTPFDLLLIEVYVARGKFGRGRVLRHMLRTFALADKSFDCAAFKAHVRTISKDLSPEDRQTLHQEIKPYLEAHAT